jgi:hypothetical protein
VNKEACCISRDPEIQRAYTRDVLHRERVKEVNRETGNKKLCHLPQSRHYTACRLCFGCVTKNATRNYVFARTLPARHSATHRLPTASIIS